MSDQSSAYEDTVKTTRATIVAALASINKAERELLGAREALVGGLAALEKMPSPSLLASPRPDRAEKHGDILVDGVKIDFDRQIRVRTEKHGDILVDGVKIDFDRQVRVRTEKHGDILVDGVKIDFDRQVRVPPSDLSEEHGDIVVAGVVKEKVGSIEVDGAALKLKEAGAEVEVK